MASRDRDGRKEQDSKFLSAQILALSCSIVHTDGSNVLLAPPNNLQRNQPKKLRVQSQLDRALNIDV